MSAFRMKLPDVGEGVAEAELVEWFVEVGDEVAVDTPLAEVLTDKATVEISSPVSGRVAELFGAPGEMLAVGSELLAIETGSDDAADAGGSDGEIEATATVTDDVEATSGPVADEPGPEIAPDGVDADSVEDAPPTQSADPEQAAPPSEAPPPSDSPEPASARRALAAPAVRARAQALGLDLTTVTATGPAGQVTHEDLDALLRTGRGHGSEPSTGDTHTSPVRGVRRQIAQRLSATWAATPHITYVDAVDVSELEQLRAALNERDDGARLTLLPFVMRAVVRAVRDQPELNAHYDHDAELLTVFDDVHVGIATQTPTGLMVPVVRDAGRLDLFDTASEVARVADAARSGRAARAELVGSTITITSLGPLGGLVTTPLINAPEVAIVGVNKIEVRPVWRDGAFQPRSMMNLSCSFDHRVVDGYDAAVFVQRVRTLLETPGLLVMDA